MKKLVIKIIVSGLLISWVFIFKVDWRELVKVLADSDYSLLIFALSLHIIGLLLSALRWQKLLQAQGLNFKLGTLCDSYLVCSFFNIFMPTRIGGDVIRINDLKKAFNSITLSASSVVVERFLGISVLLMFAFIASLIRLPLVQTIPAIIAGLAIGMLGVVLFLSVIYWDVISKLIQFIPYTKVRSKFLSEWGKFRESASQLLFRKDVLAWGLGYSFLLQLNVIIHFWIIGIALDFEVPFLDYFFLIPIQLVILMLPTINGLGLREASNIVLFGYYGISATQAATFSMIDLIMMLLVGLVGWTRFVARRSVPVSFESEQETRA